MQANITTHTLATHLNVVVFIHVLEKKIPPALIVVL